MVLSLRKLLPPEKEWQAREVKIYKCPNELQLYKKMD